MMIKQKYEKRHQLYQIDLDKVYEGEVEAKENYINPQAVLLHYCSSCNKEFCARPLWLLTKINQEHVCGVNTSKSGSKPRKKITEEDKKEIVSLANKGMSKSKIANYFGVSRPTIIKYLRITEKY